MKALFSLCTEFLNYDQCTGIFTWIKSRGMAKKGSTAGCKDSRGYVVISIGGKRHYAHRLAVLMSTGSVVESEVIDHINGDKSDNRLFNLRAVSHAVNQQNQRAPSKNNRSGFLGVKLLRGSYIAQICVDGSPKYLGTFKTREEAGSAYLDAKRELHEGCTI
jgi:hypothetical protein